MERTQVLNAAQARLETERASFLSKIEDSLEVPMLVLSFVWLLLMILEFTAGLSSFLMRVNTAIWIVFIADYAVKFAIAPRKMEYIRGNWITLAALALPALRILRVFRVARVARLSTTVRTVRLARVFTSLNRGIGALGRSLGKRGFGYVLSLTLLVTLAGAAGMFAFEKDTGAMPDYGTALWWTAMVLTTMGSDYFPKTSEGRLLCLFLAIYGFAVFGYVTAAVATFFVGRDAANKGSEIAGQSSIDDLKRQIDLMRAELSSLKEALYAAADQAKK
jgi:voltage-gated potassium channel